jgi:tetratricopeptide (TPR) repeat protein
MQYQSSYPDNFRALLARQLMELDKNDNIALKKSTKALLNSKYGEEACALYFAVLAEIRLGTEERMLELTTRALDASPDIPDLYRLRGDRFLAKKDYRSAYSDYSKLMSLRPSSIKPLQGMAKILEATNRIKPAINMYDKVLAIDSTDLEALTRLGEIYFGQQNFPMATTYYDLYLDQVKDQATIRHHRATCRYILGDIEGASEDLRQLSSFYGVNNLESQNLRGVILTEQDSLESALSVFNAIFFKNPNFQNAYFNRGRVYLKMGAWAKAVADFDKIIASDPENAYAYYERSVAKAKLKIESACADLDKAIALGHVVTEEDRIGICPP